MADLEKIFAIATANRLLAADMFAGLDEQQWATASLCEGWTVRVIAAHLVPPQDGFSVLPLLGRVIRYRGNLERMVDETARRDAQRPTQEILRDLRGRAGARLKPPVTGAAGPMADTAIHLRDAARPLGLDVNPGPASWEPVLDFLVSTAGAKGFVPRERLTGLRLTVSDGDWSWGSGLPVCGTSEAVALAIAGRAVVLPELTGDGIAVLAQRLTTSA